MEGARRWIDADTAAATGGCVHGDPTDVLAPGVTGKVSRGIAVHAVVAGDAIGVGGAVCRCTVAEIDPSYIFRPRIAGEEAFARKDAVGYIAAQIDPAGVLKPAIGLPAAVGIYSGCCQRGGRQENG